jgi:hypothetical protein
MKMRDGSETNRVAVAALILGIMSVIFVNSFIIQVAALITGAVGLNKGNELASQGVVKNGRRMAVAGMVLGGILLARLIIIAWDTPGMMG